MECPDPHFVAIFKVRNDDDGGPKRGGFGFPEMGMRAVPTRIDNSNNMATIGIYYLPNTKVLNGQTFEAPCRVVSEEYWASFIRVGLEFRIWDGRDIIDANVIKICTENWEIMPPANA